MKKLLIILLLASCTKQPIQTYSILGTWQRHYEGYTQTYDFRPTEGSCITQNDSIPEMRISCVFMWRTSYDTLFLEGIDTIQFFVTDESLYLDGVKFNK